MGANAGVKDGSIQWGDYDNDGDLDLAVSGYSGTNYRLIIYCNNGGDSFTNVAEPMGANAGVNRSSIQWGDYDNDGDLDLAVSGYSGARRLIIYRNNGGDSFTNVAEPMGANAGVEQSSIQWGDYDNDGDLDLAVSGTIDNGANNRLIIYRNNGGDSFTNVAEPMGVNVGIWRSSIQWGDYDGDDDLDLAVSGNDGTNKRLIIYRNDRGDSFTNAAEPMGINSGMVSSSIQWGDYDGDGDLDLAVSGYSGTNDRLIIYRNDGGATFTNVAEPMGVNTGVSQSSIQWGDYDGDGDLDLAVSGLDGNKRLIIYRNNGVASFTNVAEPMGVNQGVQYSSIQWGDYDGDGDLDLAVSGETATVSGSKRLVIYRNDNIAPPNQRPGSPMVNYPKGASFAQGDTVVFRWTAVTGDTTSDSAMTYNLRVGSSPGKVDIVAADTNNADSIGNTILGNVQNATFAHIVKSLPFGTYYWSVQAVDGGMMRSAWTAEETFAVTLTPPQVVFVRRGVANPPPQSVFGAVSDMPVLQIVIGPRSNGTLSSLKVTAAGSGNDLTALSASGVKLWQDGDGNGTGDTQLGSSGTISADNGSVTFSSLSVSLTKDKPLYLVATYSFAGTATAGQTFAAQIASASDIMATASGGAAFTFSGLPVAGEPVTAVSSINNNPTAPSPSSPADAATGFAPSGEITISGYSDADGDTHKCTHWQVGDSTSIFDNMHMRVNVVIPAETAGLRFKFPRGLLRGAQKHYWRARFCDARVGWSNWGTTRSFTTATETLAITPTANKTLDSNPFSKDTRPIGFKLKNGGDEKFTMLGGVKYEEEVSDTGRNQKPSTNFKFGLLTFTIEGITTGGTITISLNMPESVPATAKYFIFDAANGWLDMTSSLTSHDGDSEVFLTLTDGGTGDLDGVANGVVVDPGGFEISDGSSSSSSSDATIKYPAACLISIYLNSPALLKLSRSLRDLGLYTTFGRKITALFYR